MTQPPEVPSALEGFLALYGAGRFWDSHEVLEDEWRRTGSDFYQGLILYASAWVHWERENAHGVKAQLRKTLERLEAYPLEYLGIDVAALRDHCHAVREEVAQGTDDWPGRIAPLPLAVSRARLRGDEVELST
ncbi:MAG: DUF309 domain-containing protein [Gemmatimonadota bacterium]|nr:DUF309 domain-containing protein [Gemmatimonadota bacterium]MDH3421774.1 DUF309 domain-containing protein [Gemmatimonadota bacterium]